MSTIQAHDAATSPQLILPGLFDHAVDDRTDRMTAIATPVDETTETATAPTPGAAVFRPGGAVTLADVEARVREEEPSYRRRDTLCALQVISRRGEIDPRAIAATAEGVRALFAQKMETTLGVSTPRWRNIRALVAAAVEKHGMRQRRLTKDVTLVPDWAALFGRLEARERHALSRLARYCTAVAVPPEAVGKETLLGLHQALVAESFVKDPRNIVKRTIALANMAGKRLGDAWPMPRLSSPFKTEPFMMPLDAFPTRFGADVERWVAFVSTADPLDPDALVKPLRPATIKSSVNQIRRAASALVRGGHVLLEEMTGLGVLVEPGLFREALRAFLPTDEARAPTDAARIARTLIGIAKNFVRVDEGARASLKAVQGRLARKLPRGMGERHRQRIGQFDEPENVRRLLRFPDEEAARARRLKSPFRRAKGIERALATAILLDTGLRLNSLRTLRTDLSFRRAGGVVFLHVGADQSKTDKPLDHVLPDATVALLDEFLRDHRRNLPGCDGPFLFPGATGGPKSASAMRDCLMKALFKHTGIRLNPHAFRHVIGKIVVERDPGAYALVSRHLGHASMNTTLRSYLGTETKVASRHLHKLIDDARRGLPPET